MRMKNPGYRLCFAAFSCLLALSAAPALDGQQSSAPAKPNLQISILSGEGALNDIRQRTAREPIVQVEDENHKPVAGAAVLFLLPDSGPGGTFVDGSRSYSTVTDADGRATAHGMQPNGVAGSWNIVVQVTYAGAMASTVIHQQNVNGTSPASSSSVATTTIHATHILSTKGLLILLGSAAAAGGIAAGIVLTRGSSSTNITPGTPSVGAPAVRAGVRIALGRHAH